MRPASEALTAPGGLAERLTGLRNGAGLKAIQLAESLGWARSKVSKIENGNQVPTPDDIRAWAQAAGHPEVTDELLDMLIQVQTTHTRWRRRLREGGQASIQQELDELTRAATRIRNLQIAIIPGLLQTAGYIHGIANQVSAVYGNVDVDAAVAARIKRQEILYEPGRQFEFIFAEAALYMPPCPEVAMLGQLGRLMAMDLPNITLGIIPMGAELSMSPLNSFMLLLSRAWDELVAEALKCQLLCKEDHVAKAVEDRPEPAHSYYRYWYYGCRCAVCRAANAAKSARLRAQRLAVKQ